MCDVDASGAPALVGLGLEEMASNAHPGQGTACRRFSLADQYLELQWVCNHADAQSERTRRTRLWERWVGRLTGTCPFGLVFRADSEEESVAPFRAWSYTPAYLRPGLRIEVGVDVPTNGPAFFFLPFVTSNRGRSTDTPGVAHVAFGHERARRNARTVACVRRSRLGAGVGTVIVRVRGRLPANPHARPRPTEGRADLRPHLPLVLEW